ncbi:hypothetical protein ACWGN4_06700, partial [Streptomyces massasporeus]
AGGRADRRGGAAGGSGPGRAAPPGHVDLNGGRNGRRPAYAGWVGPALDAPQAVLDVSPFGHLPKLPGGSMEWGPVAVLTGVAVLLVAAGLAGLRHRDMST